MSRPRTLAVLTLAGTLVVAACAGGSDEAAPSDSAVTSTIATPATEVDSTTSLTTVPTSSTTPASSTTSTTVAELELPAFSEVIARRYADDGTIDSAGATVAALTEFAALFGTVDGAVPVTDDGTIPALGTAALEHIAEVWDELTVQQQTQIAERLDAVRNSAEVVYESGAEPLTEEQLSALDAAEPQGLLRRAPTNSEVRRIANEAYGWLNGKLGARALNFTVAVAPASEAEREDTEALTIVRALAPGSFLEDVWTRPCEILVYDRERLVGNRLRSTVAHEVFHCWNYTAGEYTYNAATLTPFYNEGMASWVGEQFAIGSTLGEGWTDSFMALERYPLYRTEYRAFAFWSQIASLQGPDYLWGKMAELVSKATLSADSTFQAVLSGMEPDQQAQIAATAARNSGWSSAWDFDGPGVSPAARSFTSKVVRTNSPDPVRVGAGEQQLVEFTFAPERGDPPYIVTQYSTGTSTTRWTAGPDISLVSDDVRFWCIGGECVCDDGTEPFPGIAVAPGAQDALFVGLIGPAEFSSSTAASIISLADACGEAPEPPLTDNRPEGLVGTWRASNISLRSTFANASAYGVAADGALDVAGVSGDVLMTIEEGGQGLLEYQDVRIFFNDAVLPEIDINGSGTFGWDVNDGRFRIQNTTFSLAATFPLPIDEPFEVEPLIINSEDVGGGGTTSFRIGFGTGNEIILFDADGTRGTVFFPTVWTRQ